MSWLRHRKLQNFWGTFACVLAHPAQLEVLYQLEVYQQQQANYQEVPGAAAAVGAVSPVGPLEVWGFNVSGMKFDQEEEFGKSWWMSYSPFLHPGGLF